MNKKLLAVAIGAALVAPLAHADVKVGGQAHVSADYLETTNGADTSYRWNVSSNASNFYVGVDEDLGGGMKAVVKILEYYRFDNEVTGATRMSDGDAYAGLSGGFGTVLLGTKESPVKLLGRGFDYFSNQIGDSRNLLMNNDRNENSINYASPNMGGVSVDLAHTTNVSTANAVASAGTVNRTALAVKFSNKAVTAGLGYSTEESGSALFDPLTYMLVGAKMAFGPATVAVAYQQMDVYGLGKIDTYGIGAGFKIGDSNTVKAQYYSAKSDAVGANASNVIAIGFDHDFSKNTKGYVAIASVDNGAGNSVSAFGGGHGDNPGSLAGQSRNGLSLGAIINF